MAFQRFDDARVDPDAFRPSADRRGRASVARHASHVARTQRPGAREQFFCVGAQDFSCVWRWECQSTERPRTSLHASAVRATDGRLISRYSPLEPLIQAEPHSATARRERFLRRCPRRRTRTTRSSEREEPGTRPTHVIDTGRAHRRGVFTRPRPSSTRNTGEGREGRGLAGLVSRRKLSRVTPVRDEDRHTHGVACTRRAVRAASCASRLPSSPLRWRSRYPRGTLRTAGDVEAEPGETVRHRQVSDYARRARLSDSRAERSGIGHPLGSAAHFDWYEELMTASMPMGAANRGRPHDSDRRGNWVLHAPPVGAISSC